MGPSPLIRFLEARLSHPVPTPHWPHQPTGGLPEGSTVVIVGGGLAGSAFARQLLMLCRRENRSINIKLVNSTGCNYCGGLVTDLARKTMEQLYELEMPPNLVLEKIEGCHYVNRQGSVAVQLPAPLTSTLRTSRFGVPGFDDAIKMRILEGLEDLGHLFTLIEPTVVKRLIPPHATSSGRWRVILSRRNPDHTPQELSADLVVLASGFNSLHKPMLNRFMKSTGYTPPPVFQASVTEVNTSTALVNRVGRRVYMLDGIVPGTMLAFIPKGKNWLTLTALNKKLDFHDLRLLFAHPSIREIIDLPNPVEALRCHVVCPAFIYSGPSPCFYGDGWVAAGDLSGYGRVLKDGYFAAFWGSWLAARTVFYHGITRRDFARYYHRPLHRFSRENLLGIALFNLNNSLGHRPWFNRLLLTAAREEIRGHSYGWAVHAAFRALKTGRLPYWLIGLLFLLGVGRYVFGHPLQTIKTLLCTGERSPISP
ncbi:NAD(P)/FAD-dependent oxidoreductase [Desulfotomaculum copahuensis]|uniref:FAD/NAD(P)-binding domain-containing protein n=1 Tax=Desulfotomaculum copahuensis TaxID=1838280 RepID=A0A1B7LHS3_9FIRM|nr:hypothetical protein [Desulfotomaculum copahuensis]OAT85850.1 hypothetical protein A6M21_05070 [Desulfotomaculum copahuensis]